MAAVGSGALLVVGPHGGVGAAGDVPSHHELDGKDCALLSNHHIRVWAEEDVVRCDVPRPLEPPQAHQVQHFALKSPTPVKEQETTR